MKTILISFAAVATCFLLLDAIWLWNAGERIYRPLIGELLAPEFRLAPAALFYVLYVAGIVYFCVMPALQSGSAMTAILNGAFLGLVAYGTYDLTNQATLKVWPSMLTVIDLAWGSCLTAVAAAAGFFAARSFSAA